MAVFDCDAFNVGRMSLLIGFHHRGTRTKRLSRNTQGAGCARQVLKSPSDDAGSPTMPGGGACQPARTGTLGLRVPRTVSRDQSATNRVRMNASRQHGNRVGEAEVAVGPSRGKRRHAGGVVNRGILDDARLPCPICQRPIGGRFDVVGYPDGGSPAIAPTRSSGLNRAVDAPIRRGDGQHAILAAGLFHEMKPLLHRIAGDEGIPIVQELLAVDAAVTVGVEI